MRTKDYTLIGLTATPNAFVTAQASVAGTPLTLTANAASIPTTYAVTGLEVTLTTSAGGNQANVVFKIVGKDRWGNGITEYITGGGDGVTVRTTKVFSSITSITPSANGAAGTVAVGFPQRVTSPWVMMALQRGHGDSPVAGKVSLLAVVGTPTGVTEATYSNPAEIDGDGNPATTTGAVSGASIVDESITTTIGTPVTAQTRMVRAVCTSASGTTLKARFLQTGPV